MLYMSISSSCLYSVSVADFMLSSLRTVPHCQSSHIATESVPFPIHCRSHAAVCLIRESRRRRENCEIVSYFLVGRISFQSVADVEED